MSPIGTSLRSLRCKSLSAIGANNGQRSAQRLKSYAAIDAVDGAHSAASECHRVVALKRTTMRGAVHGRG